MLHNKDDVLSATPILWCVEHHTAQQVYLTLATYRLNPEFHILNIMKGEFQHVSHNMLNQCEICVNIKGWHLQYSL